MRMKWSFLKEKIFNSQILEKSEWLQTKSDSTTIEGLSEVVVTNEEQVEELLEAANGELILPENEKRMLELQESAKYQRPTWTNAARDPTLSSELQSSLPMVGHFIF